MNDGEVIAHRDPPGWFVIGRYPEGSDELVDIVAANLRTAGFFVKVSSDVMPYKWGKLMENMGNAIDAITNAKRDDVIPIVRASQKEFQEILTQAGIHLVSQEELARDWPEIRTPLRGRLEIEQRSSTWQSLARHQGSVETEFLNGEVVRLARRLGKQAPINEMLLRISQEMAANREPPGKYTPVQLSKLLGINHIEHK